MRPLRDEERWVPDHDPDTSAAERISLMMAVLSEGAGHRIVQPEPTGSASRNPPFEELAERTGIPKVRGPGSRGDPIHVRVDFAPLTGGGTSTCPTS